jgi:hypothetical protein
MPKRAITTTSLWSPIDASTMLAHFLSGVIIGVLLGLLLAPVLHQWILWQYTKSWDHEREHAETGHR